MILLRLHRAVPTPCSVGHSNGSQFVQSSLRSFDAKGLGEQHADEDETAFTVLAHVVFTLPAPIAVIAYQNKAAVYGLLFKASAQTLLAIAADPKQLGARIGMTSVLHT